MPYGIDSSMYGENPFSSGGGGSGSYGGYNPMYGALGMGAAGALGGMFGQNPMHASMPYMNNAGNQINQYLGNATNGMNPYMQAGQGALGQYQGMLGQMANPQDFYNKMMAGFHMSPAQQFAQQQGLNAVSNNAGANGMMGSGPEAKALENYAQNNTSQMQQQYLGNMMGMYGQALNGYGNLSNMGYGAAGQVGNWNMDAGQQQADIQEAEAQEAAAQASQNQSGLGSFFGALGGMAGFL